MKQIPFITGVVCGLAAALAILTYMFPEIPKRLARNDRPENRKCGA
jgi:hypothetical protein